MATAISTVVFALIHVPQGLAAEEVSLTRMAVMWVTLGGLLAVPYLVTSQLALSLGLHLTVNLTLQNVFVLWERQAELSAAILHLEVTGPETLAGAGGLLQVVAIALGYLTVLGWLRWRHGLLGIHPSLTRLPTGAREGDGDAEPEASSAGDLAVALVAGLVGGGMAYLGADAGGHPQPWLPGAVAVAEALPLLWRRRTPVGVLVATLAVFLVGAVITDVAPAPMLGTLIAAYTVGTATSRRTAATVAVAAGFAPPLVTAGLLGGPFPWTISVTGDEPHLLDAVLGSVAAICGATLLGAYVGTRRAYVAELAARAQRLEREREERAARAVEQERNRIARELHDVAAHHLSGIALQAAALERTLAHDDGEERQMVEDIRTESTTALTAMRRLIDVLRTDDTDGRAPQPTLDDLGQLVARARAEGVDVTVDGDGTRPELPRDVELAAYRIVQESLTNVRRHADGARTWVALRHRDGHLDIEVVDDGTARTVAAGVEPGYGLLGMRERAALLGGSLEAGPRRDAAGWQVRATLPTTRQDP